MEQLWKMGSIAISYQLYSKLDGGKIYIYFFRGGGSKLSIPVIVIGLRDWVSLFY